MPNISTEVTRVECNKIDTEFQDLEQCHHIGQTYTQQLTNMNDKRKIHVPVCPPSEAFSNY
jgi:hypothetical protein